jgi:hypothetical protein
MRCGKLRDDPGNSCLSTGLDHDLQIAPYDLVSWNGDSHAWDLTRHKRAVDREHWSGSPERPEKGEGEGNAPARERTRKNRERRTGCSKFVALQAVPATDDEEVARLLLQADVGEHTDVGGEHTDLGGEHTDMGGEHTKLVEIPRWEVIGEEELEKLRRWLGDQAGVLDKREVDLLDVFVGPFARTSKSVKLRGGTAVRVGHVYGHNLREVAQCTMAIAVVEHVRPRHVWCSFPCTSWSRLNARRHPITVLGKRRPAQLHLALVRALAQVQTSSTREFSCENPLTSLAWEQPELDILHQDPFGWVRLDQSAAYRTNTMF